MNRVFAVVIAACVLCNLPWMSPQPARALAVGDRCTFEKNITQPDGDARCTIKSLYVPGSLDPATAIGKHKLKTTSALDFGCFNKSGKKLGNPYKYRVDKGWPNQQGSSALNITNNKTILRWLMRLPDDLEIQITTGSSTLESFNRGLRFGNVVDIGYETSTSSVTARAYPSYSPGTASPSPYSGGGKDILARAKIAEVTLIETDAYFEYQELCIDTQGKVVGIVNTNSMYAPSPTFPVSELVSYGYVGSKVEIRDYTGKISEAAFPTCPATPVSGNDPINQIVESNNAVSLNRTTSEKLGIGMSIPIRNLDLKLGFDREKGESLTVTFKNNSKKGFSRWVCVVPNSRGNFQNLKWTGSNNSVGRGSTIQAGMLISVTTRCRDGSVKLPCP